MQLPTIKPATPVIDEMLGAEIVFKHENGFLFPKRYEGTVTGYQTDSKGDLWLKVKSPSFNIQLWIHENFMKGYVRKAEATAALVAVAS